MPLLFALIITLAVVIMRIDFIAFSTLFSATGGSEPRRIEYHSIHRQEIESCQAEVLTAFAEDVVSPCGVSDVSPDIRVDFAGRTVRTTSQGVVGVFADSSRYCELKVLRETISRELGMFRIISVEKDLMPTHCNPLVYLFEESAGPDIFSDRSAWVSRQPWTMRAVSNSLRVLAIFERLDLVPFIHGFRQNVHKPGELQIEVPHYVKATDPKVHKTALESFLATMVMMRNRIEKHLAADPAVIDFAAPETLFKNAVSTFEKTFNYKHWIDIFDHLANDPNFQGPLEPLTVAAPDFPKTKIWWEKFESCVSAGRSIAESGACVGIEAQCDSDSIGERISGGKTSSVFETSDPNILLKLMSANSPRFCADRAYVACTERVTLELLDGLDGACPRLYPITESPSEACSQLSVFLERLHGESAHTWLKSASTEKTVAFLIEFLKMLKKVHTAGFVHNDLHQGNFFIRELLDGTVAVKVFDFGYARPILDAENRYVQWSYWYRPLRSEIEAVIDTISLPKKRELETIPAFAEFLKIVDRLGILEMPDYDRLVALLKSCF